MAGKINESVEQSLNIENSGYATMATSAFNANQARNVRGSIYRALTPFDKAAGQTDIGKGDTFESLIDRRI